MPATKHAIGYCSRIVTFISHLLLYFPALCIADSYLKTTWNSLEFSRNMLDASGQFVSAIEQKLLPFKLVKLLFQDNSKGVR